MDSTVKEGRLQGGEGRQAKKASLREVEESIMGEWTQKISSRI